MKSQRRFPVLLLIEGIRAYQSYIEEEQRQRFLSVLQERVNRVERLFDCQWYSTEEGKAISKKLIAVALRAESADKVDYFADALINASKPMFTHDKRCKFCEILKTVSLPALRVLAYETNLQKERGPGHSPQVLIDQLIQRSGMDPFLVEACVRELYMLGVFSSTTDFLKAAIENQGLMRELQHTQALPTSLLSLPSLRSVKSYLCTGVTLKKI